MITAKQIINSIKDFSIKFIEESDTLSLIYKNKKVLFDWNDHCADFGIVVRYYLYISPNRMYDDSYIKNLEYLSDIFELLLIEGVKL